MLRDNRRTVHYASGRRKSVSTQANLCPSEATTYESEDETSGRRRSKRGTPLYSKQDIREQYCISDKQVHVLETTRQPPGLFGCISSRNVSACSPNNSANILSVCVKRKMSSDENLYELSRRPPSEYAPFPRWKSPYSHFAPHPNYPYRDQFYYMRQCAPFYYDWLPEEDDFSRMIVNRYRNVDYDGNSAFYSPSTLPYSAYNMEHIMARNPSCPAHKNLPPPPPPPPPPPAPPPPPPPPPPPFSLPPSTPK
ncbi:hypothetical protein PGB90_009915 [Kerria lacca]